MKENNELCAPVIEEGEELKDNDISVFIEGADEEFLIDLMVRRC
ncbi:hypothetical protein [Mixta hanseatica]|nr:hypothetical protein [Mixta hanseatica]